MSDYKWEMYEAYSSYMKRYIRYLIRFVERMQSDDGSTDFSETTARLLDIAKMKFEMDEVSSRGSDVLEDLEKLGKELDLPPCPEEKYEMVLKTYDDYIRLMVDAYDWFLDCDLDDFNSKAYDLDKELCHGRVPFDEFEGFRKAIEEKSIELDDNRSDYG